MNYIRVEKIKDLLRAKGVVFYDELRAVFEDCCEMTLRRDLMQLEQHGFAIRIRGGAKLASSEREPRFKQRESENLEKKELIAQKAVEFLETGRSIYFDGGTTMMSLAKSIPDKRFTIMTSAPNIALEIANRNQTPSVTVIGGKMNRDSFCLSGSNSLSYIRNINIDTAVLAASGFSFQSGFSVNDFNEGEVKKLIIKKASRVIMLFDSKKQNKSLPFTFGTLEDIDIFITDSGINIDILNELEKHSRISYYIV